MNYRRSKKSRLSLALISLLLIFLNEIQPHASEVKSVLDGQPTSTRPNLPLTPNPVLFPFEQRLADKAIATTNEMYRCAPLPANPEMRANALLLKFELPRVGDQAAKQAFCRSTEVEKTAKALETTNPKKARELRDAAL